MRRSVVVVVLALATALGLSAPPASADGGSYPSNAPTIASGQSVSGGTTAVNGTSAGKTGVQFYKVNLAFGDLLTVDFTNVTGQGTEVCILAPTVTDYTVADSSCLESEETASTNKAELTYTAPSAGAFLIDIRSDTCCYSGSWAYQMIATVAHPSSVSASAAKPAVKVGKKIKIVGSVTPAGQQVALQVKSGGWQTVATTTAGATGAFKFVYKATQRGAYKLRVAYGGGNGYLPSQTSKIKVRAN